MKGETASFTLNRGDEKIALGDYTETIRLKLDYAEAYHNCRLIRQVYANYN